MALGFAPLASTPLGSAPSSDGSTAIFCGTGVVTVAGLSALIGASTSITCGVGSIVVAGLSATVNNSATLEVSFVAPFLAADTITAAGYQLYKFVSGTLTADGTHMTSGISAIPNVTNGYISDAAISPDADGGYRGVIVWDSGGGSPFYVADVVNVPPTSGSDPLIVCAVAPFFSTDTITAVGYQLAKFVSGTYTADGSHVTGSTIKAIPNVTNGWAVPLSLTLDAGLGYRGCITFDSGGGSPFYVQDALTVVPNP